jgi:serine/threonine protein kinase
MEEGDPQPEKKEKASIRDGEFNGRIYRDYKIIQPIGQGKFSFVFKAEDLRTGQMIALKLLKIFDMNDIK